MPRSIFLPIVVVIALVAATRPLGARDPQTVLWGGDAEGGAPYVEADPNNPGHLVGFEVEIMDLIGKALHRTPQFKQISFESLDQSALRGDFDMAMNGIEDTPARRAMVPASIPYYRFREVLTVRAADRDRYKTLADLRGRRVATLGGTIAYQLLLAAQQSSGLVAISYDDDVHPYSDVVLGRNDGVLLDNVLANRAMSRVAGLYTQPDAVATSHYIAIFPPDHTALRDQVNGVLRDAMRDGRLEAILRKWKIWNEDQPLLYNEILNASNTPATPGPSDRSGADTAAQPSHWEMTRHYLPSLFEAAGITLVMSFLAMALAMLTGGLVAIGRVYGNRVTRGVLTFYVEVMRGTPVLLQLFVIYYGLASVVRLPAFVAAMLGLGLNYAAYESEIYRGALEAIPRGQLEAARVLGLTTRQILWLVRAPQALRLALAPMTNDFVAMLKDSSLVSVLTVVELTKQTQIFATNMGSWIIPGALCASLYLAMSLPLGHVARRLEARWRAASG